MKYIMIEDDNGRKVPIIFPDHLVHADVAMMMQKLISMRQKVMCKTISAGFIGLGTDIVVNGESETLSLKSRTVDADYILAGEAGALMPEMMISGLAQRIKARVPKK